MRPRWTRPRPGAISVTGDATSLEVRANTLTELAGATPLARNWGSLGAVQADNAVPPGVEAVSDAGSTYHRLRGRLAELRERYTAAVLVRGDVKLSARDYPPPTA